MSEKNGLSMWLWIVVAIVFLLLVAVLMHTRR